ncbi:MAG: hypothetical protein D3914_16885 [Candidatus Electrothrix sp. LOE2]|nr:hypothetical protein [Candidatus Electrothrix sp. LOE2]
MICRLSREGDGALLHDDFESEPGDNEKEEGEEFIEAEEDMNCLGDIIFRYVEHFAVDLEDQRSEGGHKSEAEKKQAEVDQHAPKEEVFEGLCSHSVWSLLCF